MMSSATDRIIKILSAALYPLKFYKKTQSHNTKRNVRAPSSLSYIAIVRTNPLAKGEKTYTSAWGEEVATKKCAFEQVHM